LFSTPGVSNACEAPGVGTDSCLVASLANAGAVLLPYSYASGTRVTNTPSGVKFSMTTYTAHDSQQPIGTSIDNLDSEISSLRTAWTDTPIVLVGHSYGGLVAEEWWERAWTSGDHKGVTHVFSLDAPINGVFQCTAAAFEYGGFVSAEFCQRRKSLPEDRAIDNTIIRLSADGSYTAVGNVDDPAYVGLASGGGGIEDQAVYKCGDRGDANMACVASPPSLVINAGQGDTTCKEGHPRLYGTTGHDVVKACSFVVDAIVAALNQALPAQRTPNSSSSGAITVSATDNIFGAGHFAAPAPGGGSAGAVPPSHAMPAGARILDFPQVSGTWSPSPGCSNDADGGAGCGGSSTNVTAYGGISGYVDATPGSFRAPLLGVFLGPNEPADPAPPTLDFTNNHEFGVISPKLDQVFFIGDGHAACGMQQFVIPVGATRFALGMPDANGYQGAPGQYQDNSGSLSVSFTTAGAPTSTGCFFGQPFPH
jgi:hypothetical protein